MASSKITCITLKLFLLVISAGLTNFPISEAGPMAHAIEIIVHEQKAHLLLGVVIEMTDAVETISRHLLVAIAR